jgi:uncharacterized membrane protein
MHVALDNRVLVSFTRGVKDMHLYSTAGLLLGAVNKHRIAGIVVLVIGAVLVIFGGVRFLSKIATAPLIPLIGLAVIVIGILLFARVI